MSQRGKRPNRSEDGSAPVKKRKRTPAEEEEAASLAAGAWQPRSSDLKSIYNRTTTEAPAELFRKDLISAMKLPDSEPLASDEYWVIVDQWKQEWERGVQVPVNPDSLPEPLVTINRCNSRRVKNDFKLPKNKYIRITKDENFKPEEHMLSHVPAKSEASCSYDLDECDVAWLKILNSERAAAGLGPVYEEQLERVMERFELCCWDKIQSILRNEEGLGIEYDENVICDVCRSPDSEEGNEMVFCDSCNICVHQACYGITRIPEGQWLCCTCNIGKRPECVLCPNKGGAMKCTRSGQKWAHVSCALWIPEVSIGCVEKMEPITKISSIPSSRWALICVLCRERVGACIQCSVKTCKTAYHVTCAFKHGLEMRAIIEDENADDGVKLRSYCEKHSKSSKKEKSICSGSEDDDSKRKKRKDMTSEEKNQARAIRLQEIEAEFFKHVTVKDVSIHFNLDNEALQYIYNYWKLKRKSGHNKPLLPPKSEDVDVLSHKREQADLEKMKMFVQLRQDLERVRNLCYMVSRREKLSRTFFRMREQTFHKQASVLDSAQSLPTSVVEAVVEANHGPSIYDRLYSHNEAEDHTTDFETILARIAGVKSPVYSGDETKHEINGLFKDVKNNPYKKVYFNGSSKRRSVSMYGSSISSASSSDEKPKENKENRILTSSEDEKPPTSLISKRKISSPRKQNSSTKIAEKKRRKRLTKMESSSEEDVKPPKKDVRQLSRSRLNLLERGVGESCSDSDEAMPFSSSPKFDSQKHIKSGSSVYTDSDTDVSMKNDDKSSNATNDSQSKLRTKASVKEFSHKPSASKSPNKSSPENKKKLKTEIMKKRSTSKKKQDYDPDVVLLVPQREAAKKATENLKTNTTSRAKEHVEEPGKTEDKSKQKWKHKTGKEIKDSPKEEEKIKEVKEMKEVKEKRKESKPTTDVFDIDKEIDKADALEILAYVPQREAAKKAAEHIKSGLGKPVPATAESHLPEMEKNKKEPDVKSKKEMETKKSEVKKEQESVKPAKVSESKRKSSTNSTGTSSSSTSSSSDSSSSSSSDSEEEPVKLRPRSESLFSSPPRETTKRSNAKDWPFLDKGPRPAATSGSSSSSDSSASPSPIKPSSPQPPAPQPKSDSPSRAATEQCTTSNRKSTDKKQSPVVPRNEEQQKPRGRGRAPRGRPRTSFSGDRIGDADVRRRDLPDGQRVSVEGERSKSRKRRQSTKSDLDNRDSKQTKLLSPIGKSDEKLKEKSKDKPKEKSSETKSEEKPKRSREPESKLEKEIAERKASKEGSIKPKSSSTFDRLFGTPEESSEDKIVKRKEDKVEKIEKIEKVRRELIKSLEKQKSLDISRVVSEKSITSKLPENSEKIAKSPEKHSKTLLRQTDKIELSTLVEKHNASTKSFTSPDRHHKQPDSASKISEKLPETDDKVVKHAEKLMKSEHLIKSPNKELKEQIDKKTDHKDIADKKPQNKKLPPKSKSIDDLFLHKISNSETKENELGSKKPLTPKHPKQSDEITMADKIVDDHLQTHKANDLYNRQSEVAQEVFNAVPDVTKALLNELEGEKKNMSKPMGLTNQVLQNRSIFSPQPHVKDATDLLDFVNLDMGITKDDEIIKGPLTWDFNNRNIIREDSKEDSARETLNLVQKLRLGLSKKSSTGTDVEDATTSTDVENDRMDFAEQVVPDNSSAAVLSHSDATQPREVATINLELKVQVTEVQQNSTFEESDHCHQHPQPDYAYLNNCGNNSIVDSQKIIPIQQHEGLTNHAAPVEGDERWVPPSENYPNIPNVDPTNYLNESVSTIDPHYLEQFTNTATTTTQEHHKKQAVLNSLPPELEARLQEDTLKNPSPSLLERIDRRITQTPLIEPASMDCVPSPMIYNHPQAKWADCEVIPNRRSSSSSAASSTSSSSRRDEEEPRMPEVRMVNHSTIDMTAYLPTQVPPFTPNSIDNFGGYSDPSCYPVSLSNYNTQLPFPPTGPAAMFPPAFGAPFPTPHSIPSMSKPVDESMQFSTACTAAFTSSQHNMALTTAMVNLPTVTTKPLEQQLVEQFSVPATDPPPTLTPTATPAAAEVITPSPTVSNTTPTANSTLPSPSTSLKSNSSAGKKSPSKPTRTSARVTSQMMNKSPAKSPGKSPRQETALKQSGPGRGRGDGKKASGKATSKAAAAARGRGRGRGRGRSINHNDYDFFGAGTIRNKLAGTVYDFDFDDEISNDNMTDLKSMRERRKSLDIHERKFEPFSSIRDVSRSPKFSSPPQATHKSRSYNADLRELRPPTPIEDSRSKTDISLASSENDPPQIFPDVTPVLPGPVDMRTYNSNFDQQNYNEQNLLSAFATGTTETQVQDIDEDFEKELHTALTAKKPVVHPPLEAASNMKVSLSDSRNQLKVKIKGPIANYTSTVVPLPPPAIEPVVSTININSFTNNVINNASVGISSGGPSSLRRMRKKELLRQYCAQDMNMDEATSNPGYIVPAIPPRTIITIPKAVASMTSIPTKEDYRDYRTDTDDFIEPKHHRKESKARPGGLSRELRQLDLSLDNDSHLEKRRSLGFLGSNNFGLSASFDSALANKRKGRPARLTQPPVTPKLKIKFGNNTNSIVGVTRLEDGKDRIRPPKKRLSATLNKPSVEDLKRKSMKFRKMMRKEMKHKKKDRSGKKRRKKQFEPEVQLIPNHSENPTKLLFRFAKKSDSDSDKRTSGESSSCSASTLTLSENRHEMKDCVKEAELPGASVSSKRKETPRDDKPPLKQTPIKLKLARCQEGSGYVMKHTTAIPATEKAEEAQAVQPGQPPPGRLPPPVSFPTIQQPPPTHVPLKKDCEVR